MKKKYFLVLWTLFLFTGYFLYFSPLSLYHLKQKWEIIQELEEKNQLLENHNLSFTEEEFSLEKKDYFVDMGYSEKNQIIVDIRLPSLSSFKKKEIISPPAFDINSSLLSSLIFFFFFSLFIIIFFIFYYRKKL